MLCLNLLTLWAIHALFTCRPYELRLTFYTEVLNECTLLVSFYFQFLFSDFVPDPSTRFTLGWVYIALMTTSIILNLISILSVFVVLLYRFFYLRYRKDLRRRLKEKDHNIERYLAYMHRAKFNETDIFKPSMKSIDTSEPLARRDSTHNTTGSQKYTKLDTKSNF